MYVIRLLVIGIVLAGLLAGIGALAEHGVPSGFTGTLLVIGSVYVGFRMIGGLGKGSHSRHRTSTLIENVRHNDNLYKSGKANRSVVRHTTVGWRPDPIHKEDGYTPDPGNEIVKGVDEYGYYVYNTASGNREYYRVVRSGKKRR